MKHAEAPRVSNKISFHLIRQQLLERASDGAAEGGDDDATDGNATEALVGAAMGEVDCALEEDIQILEDTVDGTMG